jgi:hypothetical protein
MGCCLFAAIVIGAPRLGIFVWWFMDPTRWVATFGSQAGLPYWIVPSLGFLFLPWLTLAYVFVAPGGLSVLDWVILALALLLDLASHGGGGRAYQQRRAEY